MRMSCNILQSGTVTVHNLAALGTRFSGTGGFRRAAPLLARKRRMVSEETIGRVSGRISRTAAALLTRVYGAGCGPVPIPVVDEIALITPLPYER